jgi:hypothetical protein
MLEFEARALFCLATGRCGTLALTELLALDPKTNAYHEPKPQPGIALRPMEHFEPLQRPRVARINASHKAGKLYAETSARLTPYATKLSDELPNAKFVFLHRDPREFTRSVLRESAQGRGALHNVDDALAFWTWINSYGLDFAGDNERCRIIPAEVLWKGQATTIEGLYEWLGLQAPTSSVIDRWASRKWNERPGVKPAWETAWDSKLPRGLMSLLGYV